ncbi:zinc finger protein 862-like [Gigantopelta aegis]|uniref:zinc finger protein 862-like n=1 Tax=Gigantopelta aegis TaxID=1735272 RepID=UPI001B889AEE|nr:zinc finger protein 862-like [Gigantopelta aegis]
MDHFKDTLNIAQTVANEIVPEWTMLKTLLYKRYGANLHKTSWISIHKLFGDVVPNIPGLMDLVLTIPATSVEAERGFIVMKRVKTDFRNRLHNRALSDLLRIILLSPAEADFQPDAAVEHWFTSTDHRESTSRNSVDVEDPEEVDEDDDCLGLSDLLGDAARSRVTQSMLPV